MRCSVFANPFRLLLSACVTSALALALALPLVAPFISPFISPRAALAEHKAKDPDKRGILLAAFGTSVPEARQVYAQIEADVKARFPGVPLRWAYTSKQIRQKLLKEGRPVPSRFAASEEVLALAEEAGKSGAGSICFLPAGTSIGLQQEDYDTIIELGKVSGLPVIIQGLGARSKIDVPGAGWDDAVKQLDRAQAEGAPFYSLLIARPFDRPVAFNETNHHWQAVFSWHAMTRLPIAERRALLQDAAARAEMRYAVENQNRDPAKGTTLPAPQWDNVFVDASASLPEARHAGRSIAELAADKGVAPGDYALDLALADDFTTQLRWRMATADWTEAVEKSQTDPRIIIGTSDGGAHLAKDDQADFSSYFLAKWVRERKIWTLEEGVRQLTEIPATILGFHDRGTLHVGKWADIMIFDADEIGPLRKEFVHDLPGGVGRYKAYGRGVHATIVNGQPIVLEGELTGRLPGMVVAPQ